MDTVEQTRVTREYELAFLAMSAEQASAVYAFLERSGATLTHRGSPVSIRLAYMIKKQASAFFTFCTFTADAAKAHEIRAALDGQQGVLRSLVITPPSRQMREAPRVSPAPSDVSGEPIAPTLTNEALEQKLEEILK